MKNKQILFGTIISYISIAMQILSTLLVTPFIIKSIGDNEYGIYRVVTSLIAYLSVFNFGLGNSLIKYLSEFRIRNEKSREKTLISFMFSLSVLAVIFMLIIALFIGFNIPNLFSSTLSLNDFWIAKTTFLILLLSVIATIINDIYVSVIFVNERFVFSKLMDLFRYTIRIVLIFCVIFKFKSSIYIALIDTILAVLFLIINLVFCWVNFGFKFEIKVKYLKNENSRFYRNILRYSMLFFLNLIIEQLIWNTDTIIIGMKLSAVDVAIYGAGATISMSFSSMTQVINNLFFPKIVKDVTINRNGKCYTDIMVMVGRIQAFVAMFIMTCYLMFGRTFICNFWLGRSYELAWHTSLITMCGTLFLAIASSGHLVLRALDRQIYFLSIYFSIFLINVFVTYFAVGKFGIIGAAVVTTISSIVGMGCFILPYYKMKIGIDVKRFAKNILPIVLIYLIIGGGGYFLVLNYNIRTIGQFAVCLIIYTIIYIFIAIGILMKPDEKAYLKNIAPKKRDK